MSINETNDSAKLGRWLVFLVVVFLATVSFVLWLRLNGTPIYQRETILDEINSVIPILQTLATFFGGITILLNVYYGAKRTKAFEKNAIAANKNANAAEQGQLTERFTKAIEQLGSDNISIRLGGIYALESIAEYSQKGEWSERYHWTVMEVLSAFVRETSPLKEDLEEKKAEGEQQLQKLRTDIQAALIVIGRRNLKKDPDGQRLDLRNSNIRGANLIACNLQRALLDGANLQEA